MNRIRAKESTATRTRLPPIGIDPSTAEGLSQAYALGANECLIAAKTLDDRVPDLSGEYIVTFHAIELGLKALLIKQGMSADELRRHPYGHDLVRLYEAAKQRGLH
jgi:hypothetical protein